MIRAALITLALGLPVAVSAQSLTAAVDHCSNPMTSGPTKIATMADSGWVAVENPQIDHFTALAASVGPTFIGDLPLPETKSQVPQIASALADAHANGILTLYQQGEALLMIGVSPQPDTGLEHVTCLFAGPTTDEVATYWQQYGPEEEAPLLGRKVLLFTGSVMNVRDDITYTEFQNWSRVPSDLSPLTDSYRYERLQNPPS